MRLAEVCAIQWADVGFDSGRVSVTKSSWGATKNGKTRSLTLPDAQLARLRRVKVEQAERLLLRGVRQTERTTIAAKSDGTPMAHQTLAAAFSKFATGHGFRDLVPWPPTLECDRAPHVRCRCEDGRSSPGSQPGPPPTDLCALRAVGRQRRSRSARCGARPSRLSLTWLVSCGSWPEC